VRKVKIKDETDKYFIYRYIYEYYPQMEGVVSEVNKNMGWDVTGAMSFCLHLLEDVNAHSVMAQVSEIFNKFEKEI